MKYLQVQTIERDTYHKSASKHILISKRFNPK